MKHRCLTKGGYVLIQVLVLAGIGVILVTAITSWAALNLKNAKNVVAREKAFQAAEAGLDYYRWHLAHASQDFQDGTGHAGPYPHEYKDKDGNTVGGFTLTITPPLIGSTVVTIVSDGTSTDNPNIHRKIEAKLAIPSIAKFAFVANSAMRFGEGTEVFGPIHSNDGIRFDGVAHNLITSAKDKYTDPDPGGGVEFGVHTHIKPPPGTGAYSDPVTAESPPHSVDVRNDVFMSGRQFPVPAVDFNGFTQDLSNLKSLASSGGKYLTSSGQQGYLIILKTNGTYDLYKVTSLVNPPRSGCSGTDWKWGTWSINNKSFVANYPFPANGIIFVEDNVWVEGQVNGARLTIASGRFPEDTNTNTSITVNNNLLYTNKDGRDVVALIAQGNINVGLKSANVFEIDAAMVAKNGRVGRYYYPAGSTACDPDAKKSTITIYGMLGSNKRYGFSYTDNTGYTTRNINYDPNLLYGPPPSFPLTADQYQTISWREISN